MLEDGCWFRLYYGQRHQDIICNTVAALARQTTQRTRTAVRKRVFCVESINSRGDRVDCLSTERA